MKKMIFLLTLSLLFVGMAWGQGSETFENHTITGTNYVDGSFVGDNAVTWNYVHVTGEQAYPITNKGILLRRSGGNSKIFSSPISGGIGSFSVQMRKAFTGDKVRQVALYINNEHVADSQTFGEVSGADETIHTFSSNDINIAGDVIIEVRHISGGSTNAQLVLDNLTWTGYTGGGTPTPTITVTSASLTGFTYVFGNGFSDEQSFIVSGTNLTNDIIITPPANYEISTGTGNSFGAANPITLTQNGGNVSDATIYVRLKTDLSVGTYNDEEITTTSVGAADRTVICSGEVTAPPAPAAPEATAATDIDDISFIANWNSVSAATGYRLDVYESSSAPGELTEGFEGASTDTPPEDWTLSADGSYIQSIEANAHSGTNYAGMNRQDGWVQTPLISDPTSCTFWARTSAASANFTAKVQSSPDGVDWTDQATYTATPTDAGDVTSDYTEKSVDLNLTGNYYLRWVMSARTGGSFYFDDVSILANEVSATFVAGYENLDVGNVTSYNVTGLNPNTTYYYVVRAYHDYQTHIVSSVNSNEIEVTTTDTPAVTFDYPNGERIDVGNGVWITVLNGDGNNDNDTTPTPVPNADNFITTFEQVITLYGRDSWTIQVESEDAWIACLHEGVWYVMEIPPQGGYPSCTIPASDSSETTIQIVTGNGNDPTLPVELSSFTVALNANNNAEISWVTQSETEMSGYYIYRNSDKDLAEALLICDLIPATNSSEEHTYLHTDEELSEMGTYYYWLEATNLDGTESFFGPITLTYEADEEQTPELDVVTCIKSVFPNPFNPNTTVSYTLATPSKVRFAIYNSRGQLVKDVNVGSKDVGDYTLTWDGNDQNGRAVTTGVYFIRMDAGSSSFSRKVVLMK